jgi:ribosomal protein S9
MSTFKQLGMQGVFLQIGKAMGMDVKAAQKMGVKFNLVFETMQGMAQELGPLMNMLGQFGPMGIAAGGIVGFFMLDDADRQAIVSAIAPMWEKIKKGAAEIWYGSDGKTGLSTWLAESWDSFKAYVTSKWPEWKETIMGAFSWIVKELGPALMEGVKTVGGAIVSSVDGSTLAIGGAITAAIVGAKVFGGGPMGMAAMATAALSAGILAAFEMLDRKLEDADAKVRGLTKDTGDRRREHSANRNEWYQEQSKKYGLRGEKVTSEGVAEDYGAGNLAWYESQLQYSKSLKFTAGMSQGQKDKTSKLQQELARQEAIAQGLGAEKAGAIKYAVVDRLSKQMEVLQQLPEVQKRLWEAQSGGISGVATEMRDIAAEYAPIMGTTVPAMLDQAEAVRLAIAELEAAGSTEWSEDAFGPASAEDWLSVDQILQQKAESEQFSAGAYTAGVQIIAGEAAGVSDTMPILEDAVNAATQFVSDTATAHSPIVSGPLAGVGAGGDADPAFMAGYTLMESFAMGIDASSLLVAEAVTRVMDDSVLLTFDAYRMKVEELAKKKPMLASIAEMMVRDFGGSIKNIEVEGKTENVKANLQAMLSIPGIAGVVAAVVSEGAKTRQILDKIRDNTEKVANAVGEKGGKPVLMTLAG